MNSKIILRKVAAAAVHLFGLHNLARRRFHQRPNRQAILDRARQFESYPMISIVTFIFQDHRPAIEITHYHVNVAIIK